jgi:hypothetical protein
LQAGAANQLSESRKRKRGDDDNISEDALDLENAMPGLEDEKEGGSGSEAGDGEDEPLPMGTSGSISEIRAKLHAKIASFKKGRKAEEEAGCKDELLEMRRQQRGAMRERRRKETKEKKQKEKEEKKKGKGKAASGHTSRVRKAVLVHKQ